ncbi:MFS transporter [Virgisporangium aurantiacum]|uniref:MFS transporter n=1 Tax=Virgisporangium aurantiacum TaxID=175570 RepID=A0A8J3ZHL1_9ACTN|nr:MFS transporter [Virgisporangium aurantiacum]GIJ63052.1 MFS transporter [Virgisporangium aurantiacum]
MRVSEADAGWRRDWRWLWAAYAVSEAGTAVGAGALPLLAVLALNASALQVSMLAAISGVAAAIAVVPLAPWVERHRKRPVMIAADLLRLAALGSVSVAAVVGLLTFVHLLTVAAVQTAAAMVFAAASGAHMKQLVPPTWRARSTSRFETTFWIATFAGPPLGGLLLTLLGATATIAIDAVSFLASAAGIRRLRTSEPPPAAAVNGESGTGVRGRLRGWLRETSGGWRYIAGHVVLRPLFANALVFGGAIMAAAPLTTVLMLRELGFTPLQYGFALGLPAAGGIVGSLAAPRLLRQFPLGKVLLAAGAARAVWLGLIPLAPPGTAGLIVIVAADTMLLACAGAFNPLFATYRMQATADAYMTRVATAWAVTSKPCSRCASSPADSSPP